MSDYVNQGVFPEDPFHTLDTEGVGELCASVLIVRVRLIPKLFCRFVGNMAVALNPCVCRQIGMDYVSCSPFRVPVAKLAAAQLAIASKTG